MKIVSKKGRGPEAKSIVLEFDFGKDLDDAVKKYTAPIVFDYYVNEAKIVFQNKVRGLIAQGKTEAEITETMKTWKPGEISKRGKSPVEKIAALLSKLTPEQRAAVKASLGGK